MPTSAEPGWSSAAQGDSPAADGLPLLTGYAPALRESAHRLLTEGRLSAHLQGRYPDAHTVRSDADLYRHATALKQRHMRNAPPLSKVLYDTSLRRARQALGTLTTVSRVQGSRLQAKREIRIAALFRQAPAAMLQMIVVHELAHLKVSDHDRSFYALCEHMLPGYGQLEFDTRLYLTLLDSTGADAAPRRDPAA